MKYIGILNYNYMFIIIVAVLTVLFFISILNVTFIIEAKNEDLKVKINLKFFLNLININKNIYPPKPTQKIKEKGENKKVSYNKVKLEDLDSIFSLIKNLEIYDIYSNIKFGNKDINFTAFIYVFINTIYGSLASIINPTKMYLNVTPDFTKDYFEANIKIHTREKLIKFIIIAISINKIRKNNKEVRDNEINRFNSKTYGNNS